MIRFPNPGSDILSFIRIYKILYKSLNFKSWFTLDDMSVILTNMNLAASSGYVGKKALALSTRKDRSRDPLYNQSKMYSELYRILGWIVSDKPDTALKFRFTLLGDHVAIADSDPKIIFEESILGICYPNRILDIKGTEASRVFLAILKIASRLNDYICRDELILGVLNKDDIGERSIAKTVEYIMKIRGNSCLLLTEINNLAKHNKIQVNTMYNYTRFPLAVLLFCKWFERSNENIIYKDNRNMVILKMTSYGKQRTKKLESLIDIRLSDYDKQSTENQKALIRIGFYTMLQRANFDITPAIAQIATDRNTLNDTVNKKDILFSPYQTLRPEISDEALGVYQNKNYVTDESHAADIKENYEIEQIKQNIINITLNQINNNNNIIIHDTNIEKTIISLIKDNYTNNEIANRIYIENSKSMKDTFYPLIVELFKIIGFNCQLSQAGNNYERWDAIIIDDNYSIPIEIKSPSEEQMISIKAVRQALENKIILLSSRRPYNTDRATVSIAVGYNNLSDNAEVFRLIKDIHNTFNINIGIIDFRSLLLLAISKLRGDNVDFIKDINDLQGILCEKSV